MLKTPKKIGKYPLGARDVELYVRDGTSGEFDCTPESGVARITVGLGYEEWPPIMNVVVHEAMEMALTDLGARYSPCVDYAMGSDSYVFHFDHAQFSEACGRTGHFLSACMDDLMAAYRPKKRRHRPAARGK